MNGAHGVGLVIGSLGSANSLRFEDPTGTQSRLTGGGTPVGRSRSNPSQGTLILIFISAIIFITLISYYEVIRSYLSRESIRPLFQNRVCELQKIIDAEGAVPSTGTPTIQSQIVLAATADQSAAQLIVEEWNRGLIVAAKFAFVCTVIAAVALFFLIPWYFKLIH